MYGLLQFALKNQILSDCFDVNQDTSLSVALEMVEGFELSQGNILIIAQLIEAFLLILISEWVPCVDVCEVVSESAHSYITKIIMNGSDRLFRYIYASPSYVSFRFF